MNESYSNGIFVDGMGVSKEEVEAEDDDEDGTTFMWVDSLLLSVLFS